MGITAQRRITPVSLKPGHRAPDIALRNAAGVQVRLSHLWAESPGALVLVFVRHFG